MKRGRTNPFAKPRSLRFWLGWLILAYVIPASAITGYFLVDSYRRERATIGRDMVTTARTSMQTIDSELLGAQEALQVLAASLELDPPDLAAFHARATALLPLLHGSNLVLLDATGAPLLNTLKPFGEPLPRDASSERIARVVESAKPGVSNLFRGAISKQPLIAIDVPVVRDGRVAYVLAMGYFSSRLGEILRRQDIPAGWVMAVRDAGGTIVARNQDELIFVGEAGSPDIQNEIARADEGSFLMRDTEGVRKLGAFSRSPVTHWTISVGVPEHLLTHALWISLIVNGVAAFLLMLAGMLLASAISHRLMRSVSALTMPALALGAGEAVVIPSVEISELEVLSIALAEAAKLIEQRGVERDAAETAGRELMIAKETAEASDRAKSGFLALVSHELRTPMNGIIGFGALLQNTQLTASQKNMVNRLRESGGKLLNIITDILDLSEIEAGKLSLSKTAFNFPELVAEVILSCELDARRKGLELRVILPTTLAARVVGDPVRLRRVVQNLLANAIKFTSQGHVELRLSVRGRDKILFEIEDTGIGIPLNRQACLFQPFTQADATSTRAFGGAGLGLAICKRLIEAMPGGAIGFESVEDLGSRFWFELELPEAKSATDEVVRSDAKPSRILVAEDNVVNQILIEGLLTAAGHEVVVVADGRAAVMAIQDGHFDLILMDLQMPVMDGIEATRAIRRLDGVANSVAIVAVTANAMGLSKERFCEAGIDDVLSKPINADHLLDSVAAWSLRGSQSKRPH